MEMRSKVFDVEINRGGRSCVSYEPFYVSEWDVVLEWRQWACLLLPHSSGLSQFQ